MIFSKKLFVVLLLYFSLHGLLFRQEFWKESSSRKTRLNILMEIYTGWSKKSIPQILFDNYEQWIAKIKIEKNAESRTLSLKHIKKANCLKTYEFVKIRASLTDLVKCVRIFSIISNSKVCNFTDIVAMIPSSGRKWSK